MRQRLHSYLLSICYELYYDFKIQNYDSKKISFHHFTQEQRIQYAQKWSVGRYKT
jgi:hypothetical protein